MIDKQRRVRKRTARDIGENFKEGIVAAVYLRAERFYVDARNGNVATQAEDKKQKKSYEDLLSYFLDLKTILNCFKHFEPLSCKTQQLNLRLPPYRPLFQ